MSRSYPHARDEWTSYDDLRMQAWARHERRMESPLTVLATWALGLLISCAFWGVLIVAFVVGQR